MDRKTVSRIMLTLLLIGMLNVAFDIIPVEATPTIIYVDPTTSVANPDEYFAINISVVEVPTDHGVISWESKLKFDPDILYTNETMVTEGDFLSNEGMTFFTKFISGGYMMVGCMLLEPVTASGSGTLATIKFRVVRTGKCSLHLYETGLLDIDINPIDHTVEDGVFYTTYPRADFIYYTEAHPSPSPGVQPLFLSVVNELITFDASFISFDGIYGGSYDPDTMTIDDLDGNITSYSWDFDDGNTTSVPNSVITHVYDTVGSYAVSLTVTDNEGLTDSEDRFVEVVIHDIAITNVEVYPTVIRPGELATINITVLNEGTEDEFFNVTCCYDTTAIWYSQTIPYNITLEYKAYSSPLIWDPIAKMFGITLEPDENMTITFTWNTTEVTEGTYTILANASLVDSKTKFLPGEIDIADNRYENGDVIVTWGAPMASFTFSPQHPMVDEIVTFDSSGSNDLDGWIVSCTWDFGDGTITTVDNTTMVVAHAYDTVGTYRVNLTVTDNDDLKGTNIQSVTVSLHDINITSVSVSPTTVTVGENVSVCVDVKNEGGFNEAFDVTVYYEGSVIETRTGITLEAGTDTTLTFTWNTSGVPTGTYTIKTEASVVPGETDIGDNMYVDGDVLLTWGIPVAKFTFSPEHPTVEETVTFDASASYDPDGTIVCYEWDFGEGTTGMGEIATHAYAASGIYMVTLTVTDNDGLTDTATDSVAVLLKISRVYVDPAVKTALPGETFTVNVDIGDVDDLYGWQFYMRWSGPILNVTRVTEGDFLSRGGIRDTFFKPKIYNEPDPKGVSDYVGVWCTLMGRVPGEFGTGTLATITFLVEAEGESVLDIYGVELRNSLPTSPPLEHTVEDGYFFTTPIPVITATLDVHPATLNLKSKGKWITAAVQLPEGYNAEDIDISTILLNDLVPAEWGKAEANKLMVKFARKSVIDLLGVGEATLTITGKVNDIPFEGSDTIRVIDE